MSTETVRTYIKAVPADFEVYSGNDREVIRLAESGGAGIVSGISTVYPKVFVDAVAAINTGGDAAAFQDEIDQVVASVGGGDISLLKAGVAMKGLPAGPTRVSLEPPTLEALAALSEQLNLTTEGAL
ncbi:4-hydroxy-tetrahydrodipicolinate synthase [Arthrobacter sp. Hiyo6]|nr:4-hydroxy-tetrahydrodipicolinate synthase [Arthrobacter sp. Hiyo6]